MLSCNQTYTQEKSKFLSEIEAYSEGDDDENEAVRTHLRRMVEVVEMMQLSDTGKDEFLEELDRMVELMKGKEPAQAMVFFFNTSFGEISFSTYGSLYAKAMMPTELSLSNRINNEIMGPMGPLEIINYSEICEDVVYEEEIEDCSIEMENDALRELCSLKAYAIFESLIEETNLRATLADTQLLFPFYLYIQEHDGGISNQLQVWEYK